VKADGSAAAVAAVATVCLAACAAARPSASPGGSAAPGDAPTKSTSLGAPGASSERPGVAPGVPVAALSPRAALLAPAPVPTSKVATTRVDPSWGACSRGRGAITAITAITKNVASDVGVMAAACAGVTRMKLVGATLTGKQADQDGPQAFPFDAKSSHCYRAYGRAGDGIKSVHLVIEDSLGIAVAQDGTGDTGAPGLVVPQAGAVCFATDDHASVVVSVGMGGGEYAVQIWQD
jgi:hypothetical protein